MGTCPAGRRASPERRPSMSSGLDGVIVAETELSEVDGAAGRLVVCGEPIERLTGRIGFAALAARLWSAGSGEREAPEAVAAALGAARAEAFAVMGPGLAAARGLPPLEGLRLMLAGLPASADRPAHHRLA